MSAEYTSFLAARVLNENKLITYRLLSRELNIHVTKAKEYLTAFHESENRKRSGSCHATYVITGLPKPLIPVQPKTDDDDDTYMEGDPAQVPTQGGDEGAATTTSVLLVTEEELEETKALFQEIRSIHIYSIEPGPLKDLLVIADASTELYSRFQDTDPVEKSKLYGTTLNKSVKRREGAAPPPPLPASTKSSTYVVPVKKAPVAQDPAASTAAPPSTAKDTKKEAKDFFSSARAKKEDAPKSAQTPDAALPKSKVPLKRGQSDLMSSFSNAQPKKAKQPEKKKTPPPDFMDVDDDEPEEDEPVDEEAKTAEAAKQEEARKKRQRDQEDLEKMMDDDEEDEPAPTKPINDPIASPASPDPVAESPSGDSPVPAPSASESAPGRRKAKRKVTKKVRSKDENGYIITREVTEWEEYSEDDIPVPSKPAAKPNAFAAMKQAAGSQKAKKGSGEGVGKKVNIASFFQKK
ncbi:hypothetical protein DRE_00781 [Drechslerella stenobrocha 248]|uniref:DNA polymerase delta subunit 3 n=1 Tax=Drechslerella stenobrocha 248 TaxID=1043628 RepID=W7HYW4_9PEZI|nr:hypothetical protein DRE_00781 [Drechslerella stenobrocha 248]